MQISSYPKIFNLGHAAVSEIFLDEVVIEEKIDGSQFSFGKLEGKLCIRSKGVEINPDDAPKMFQKGVDYVKSIESLLIDGYTYRGEYLEKPKHNTLAYDRIPKNNIILFDINSALETYMDPVNKRWQADRLDLEVVPLVFHGRVSGVQNFLSFMETISCLGGQRVEGLVVKNYHRFGIDKKVLLGKYVSEGFKEVHGKSWGMRNPGQNDFFTQLGNKYRSEVRWNKAIQHLKERGELTNSPADIGPLLKEIQGDTMDECMNEIREALFQWGAKQIRKQLALGFPEWYKHRLLGTAFPATSTTSESNYSSLALSSISISLDAITSSAPPMKEAA